jgi:predicted porin
MNIIYINNDNNCNSNNNSIICLFKFLLIISKDNYNVSTSKENKTNRYTQTNQGHMYHSDNNHSIGAVTPTMGRWEVYVHIYKYIAPTTTTTATNTNTTNKDNNITILVIYQ